MPDLRPAFSLLHPPKSCKPPRKLQLTLIPAGPFAQPGDRHPSLGRLKRAHGWDSLRSWLQRAHDEVAREARHDGIDRIRRHIMEIESRQKLFRLRSALH